MHRCTRCDGFVPEGIEHCPNCRSGKKAWWMAPLTFAGGAIATVTLSACYGSPCAATTVTRPDGGTTTSFEALGCGGTYDCRTGPDGGAPVQDAEWKALCE